MLEIIRIDENTWRIEDETVRFFLLTGDTEALMIDTGMRVPDAKSVAEGLTDLPVRLLNTHADPDHVSGNGSFEAFYMHPAEWENFHGIHGNGGRMIPIRDGDGIDLGGRTLRVIELPGHTPGSIALLDEEKRVLFGGDAIQDGRIFMFGKRRNLNDYAESLRALVRNHGEAFDPVYPSHGTFPVSPDIIPKLIRGAEEILSGENRGKCVQVMGHDVQYHQTEAAAFLCDCPEERSHL